ncbi:MAG: hypothetical protein HYY09_02060 [Firmicutes bacterium]|nr:hypothetical protein [Bacillota bacterium]
MNAYDTVWPIQEIDLRSMRLQRDIETHPLLGRLEESGARVKEARQAKKFLDQKLETEQRLARAAEMEARHSAVSKREIQTRLYGGMVSNPKELASLEHKLGNLDETERAAEEKAIFHLALAEEMEQQVGEAGKALAELEAGEAALRAEKETSLGAIRKEIESLAARRLELAAAADPAALTRYEELRRRRKDGVLARVVGGICGGCRVSLSPAVLAHARTPGRAVNCENCGRLLISDR